jgi:hypothetical protein
MNGQQKSAHDALKVVAGDLSDWSQNILGDFEKRIKKVKKRTGGMQEDGHWS